MRSKLLEITIKNIGCIGPEAVTVRLDDVLCLVGPNNSGKTTVLRAYELAVNPGSFDHLRDHCNWSGPEELSEIVLDVHIPRGMGNVDEKWKITDGSKSIVRSRWVWPKEIGKATRQTWDPEISDWAEDGKAGGADNVFTSRLPKPMRINSLDDAISTEDILVTLALSPFVKELRELEGDENSQISRDKLALTTTVNKLTETHKERLDAISTQVKDGFQGIFPGVGVHLHVEMPVPDLKLEALLKQGSGIRIAEPAGQSQLIQQGTGARRALFWAMLQVHNEISRQTARREALLKDLRSDLKKQARKKEGEEIALLERQIASLINGDPVPEDVNDPALPGYILLIDEPENALHPMAARAAQKHLYTLGQHEDWQVLLTTHSPYFINPLEDHTTIARLERSGDGKFLSPRVYVADEVKFSSEEMENLKALQLTDVGFSEIFFGSYPVLVEGDTEHAAFISAVVEAQHELARKISIIRARGKAVLVPLIKMLRHFKTSFGILHDVDWPFRENGSRNGMWTVNKSMRDEVLLCRGDGVTVRHRWSVPDFERFLGGEALGKDKPYAAFARVSASEPTKEKVRALLQSLFDSDEHDPAGHDPGGDFIAQLEAELREWAGANGETSSARLNPPAS